MFSVAAIPIPSISVLPMGPMISASDVNKPSQSSMENVPVRIQAALMKEEPMNVTSVLSE